MSNTRYNRSKIIYWIGCFMVIVMGVGPLRLTAVEKPVTNHLLLITPQDDKTKPTDENIIPQENVKLFLNQIEIYGQIAKPQAVFIIPGTDPRVDGLRIDRHFFSNIFRPVEKSTLRNVRNKQAKDKDHILW